MTTAYAAVTYKDEILVNTVSSTERAAMVNWLVVHGKVMIFNSDVDDYIASLFHEKSTKLGLARILKVNIMVPE